jgi:ribosomal protein S18 acetylase RimI-like enzyme
VRPGTARDHDFIRDLGRRTAATSASGVRRSDPRAVETAYLRLVEFLAGESHVLLVAESAGRKLGFLILLDRLPDEVTNAPQAFIAYMAVESDAQREGVATALLERAEQIARERGLPAMALMVTEENRAARELYAKAGFVTERRLLAKPL